MAELCINKIYENKFLVDQKARYKNHLIFIKTILTNKTNSINLKKELKELHESLKLSINLLKKEKKKIIRIQFKRTPTKIRTQGHR